MDHMMPVMDGIEAKDEIRALGTEYARTIPIIALTANAVSGTEEMFYQHGFQAFLSKPVDLLKLDGVIKEFVQDKTRKEAIIVNLDGSVDKQVTVTVTAPAIAGLDVDKGLIIAGEDWELYLKVLRSYVSDTSTILDKMRLVTQETLPDYAISVHGIKGASANIGAESIRTVALALEMMAKAGDLPGVLAQNDDFLQATEDLVAKIQAWLQEQNGHDDKPLLPTPDSQLLAQLRDYCENFDASEADKIMEELERFSYETDADLIIWLREKMDLLDYDEIVERLARF
jgi:CheY-like chemotaxis protein